MGTIVVYSNASVFSPTLAEALRKNKVIITTSLDTGLASSYDKLKGGKQFTKVIRNLIRYRNTGTQQLWLKCVITETNRTEDDLWSFVMAMLALRPNKVMICPDFPYGKTEVDEATVKYAARLWYAVDQLLGLTPTDYTAAFGAPEWVKYREDLSAGLADLRREQRSAGPVEALQRPRATELALHSIGRLRASVWRGGLRKRLAPAGSARERLLVLLYRRTLGRLIGE